MADNGLGAMPLVVFLIVGLIATVVAVGFFMYAGYERNIANMPSHLSLNMPPRHP